MATITDPVFPSHRQEGDVNLVDIITNLLMDEGHPDPQAWLKDPLVQEASTASPKLQQFLINRYWRVQLGLIAENTSAERYCLIEDGEVADYITIFRDAVAPAIIRHQLPRSRTPEA